jgi:hypothetical protein
MRPLLCDIPVLLAPLPAARSGMLDGYDLAAVIMVLITIAALGRLLRRPPR